MSTRKFPLKVAVIGAGAAGLCSGRHLISDPDSFVFDIFEQQNEVGGTWRYSERVGKDEFGLPVHSSVYKNLKTNLPKEAMAFHDFPFPNCNGLSFLHHTQVLQYLKDYAQHHAIYKHIKFFKQVENVRPLKHTNGHVEWHVSYCDVITQERDMKVYDAVIVCNGHYSVPHIPEIKGIDSFKGLLIHSHDYRVASDFKDMRVVVLGAGPSGVDIAIELSSEANQVVLSHNLPVKQCPLPENLKQERGIESINVKSVVFFGGNVHECDAIVLCTGYKYDYAFIDPVCKLQVGDQQISPLYLHTFHIDYPTLSILAITKLILPFPIYDQQVKVILKYLKGIINLPTPDKMRDAEKEDFEKRLESGFKQRHAHILPGEWQWNFDDDLCKLGGIEPISDTVRNLFRQVHFLRTKDLVNYKKTRYCLHEDKTYVPIEQNGGNS